MGNRETPFVYEAESPSVFGQVLAAIGKSRPVYYDEHRGAWIMLRHRDVHAAFRRPEVFSSSIYGLGPTEGTFVALDGAEHARQRRIFSRAFGPRAIQRYERDIIAPA